MRKSSLEKQIADYIIQNKEQHYRLAEGKLVISFDKYEVAPGYMGMAEFTIPTEILSKILAGDEYIK